MHLGHLGNSRCMNLRSNVCLLRADIGRAAAGAGHTVSIPTALYTHTTIQSFVLRSQINFM